MNLVEPRSLRSDSTHNSVLRRLGQATLACALMLAILVMPVMAAPNGQDGVVLLETAVPRLPDSASVRQRDAVLALLSYAVYADDAHVRLVKQTMDRLKAGSLVPPGGPGAVRGALEAQQRRLDQLRDQMATKARLSTQGIRRVPLPELEAMAQAHGVYFETYDLPQGLRAVVFRGTDNTSDVATDLSIGLSPDMLADLQASFPFLSGKLAVLTEQHGDEAQTGRPANFEVADQVVAAITRAGTAPERLVVAGHSLGGGYATYAGVHQRAGQVVGFNPAPLNSRQLADIGADQASAVANVRYYSSYIPSTGGRPAVLDPVSHISHALGGDDGLTSMKVMGRQYVSPVCVSFATAAYRAFDANLQAGLNRLVASVSQGAPQQSMDCRAHPILCGVKAAAQNTKHAQFEAVSRYAWSLLSAHRIRELADSLRAGGQPACQS
ncbi:hypothetical protein UUC_03525 [Rhodanobacter denitrificans]|nr:hypothetical protein UUC_03525 [Rhodanobacter denitrificans]